MEAVYLTEADVLSLKRNEIKEILHIHYPNVVCPRSKEDARRVLEANKTPVDWDELRLLEATPPSEPPFEDGSVHRLLWGYIQVNKIKIPPKVPASAGNDTGGNTTAHLLPSSVNLRLEIQKAPGGVSILGPFKVTTIARDDLGGIFITSGEVRQLLLDHLPGRIPGDWQLVWVSSASKQQATPIITVDAAGGVTDFPPSAVNVLYPTPEASDIHWVFLLIQEKPEPELPPAGIPLVPAKRKKSSKRPAMTDDERAAYIAENLRQRFANAEFCKLIPDNKKVSMPLPTVLTIVDGVNGIIIDYQQKPLFPPWPVPASQKPYRISDIAIGDFLDRDREWVSNCKKVTKLLAMRSIRRRCRQINNAYSELFPDRVAAEGAAGGVAGNEDDDAESDIDVEPDIAGWGVASVLKHLEYAEKQEAAARRRMGQD